MADQPPEEQGLLTNEIRELLELICQTDITELEIKRGDAMIHVKRGMQGAGLVAQTPLMGVPYQLPLAVQAAPAAPAAPPEPAGYTVTSPMVGTYYSAPSPKDPAYVQVGDEVHPGDVVGIVEAMKMMNEIECEIHGRVLKVLVQNGQPVEYGQPLIIVEPLPQQI